MVRERLGLVLHDASMVLAGDKDAADLCFNEQIETAKFVTDETRYLHSQQYTFLALSQILRSSCFEYSHSLMYTTGTR